VVQVERGPPFRLQQMYDGVQLGRLGVDEVRAPHHRPQRGRGQSPDGANGVPQPCVAAAAQQDDPAVTVEDQRHVIRVGVRDEAPMCERVQVRAATGRVGAGGDRAGGRDAAQDLLRLARKMQFGQRRQRLQLQDKARRVDAVPHAEAGLPEFRMGVHGQPGIAFEHGRQPTRVVEMGMAEGYGLRRAVGQPERIPVVEENLAAGAGVPQEPPIGGLRQYSQPVLGAHGGAAGLVVHDAGQPQH